ncbi:MAG: MlaD family protein [Hyphomonadaceae bacterium]|nr:MlaD family protein [Hyphomonadaceae bacterium]
METKANYILLGAATIAGALLIMLFAMWLAGGEYRQGFQEYDIVFDDPVRGLAEGGEVRFNGIKVGEVQTLRIDPDNTNRVIARVRISSDVPVRADSTAQLEPVGLTGVTLIQLSPGLTTSQLLRPTPFGATPRIQGRGSQIDLIVARGEDIAMRASEAVAAVRDLLTDENIARVTRIIENLEVISDRLADERSVINRSGEAAGALADAARSIDSLAVQTQRDLAELDEVMSGLRGVAATASDDTLPELAEAALEIRRAAASINRVANDLDESPSLLTPRPQRPTVELTP